MGTSFNKLTKQNILLSAQYGAAAMDFTSFCCNKFKNFTVEFEEFKKESDWLDNFFFQKVNIQVTKLLVLSSDWSLLSVMVKLLLRDNQCQQSGSR